MEPKPLGYVLGGSLQEGLVVRLQVPPHEVHEGAFVVMDAAPWRFYGVVTDVAIIPRGQIPWNCDFNSTCE